MVLESYYWVRDRTALGTNVLDEMPIENPEEHRRQETSARAWLNNSYELEATQELK